jgi:DNA damage-binding protein 1
MFIASSVCDSYTLGRYEYPSSIQSVSFGSEGQNCFVVGTAFVIPTEEEPSKGRIMVMKTVKDAETFKFELVCETEVAGCVHSLVSVGSHLAAGINSKVAANGLRL